MKKNAHAFKRECKGWFHRSGTALELHGSQASEANQRRSLPHAARAPRTTALFAEYDARASVTPYTKLATSIPRTSRTECPIRSALAARVAADLCFTGCESRRRRRRAQR
jgi:hypothetical protein